MNKVRLSNFELIRIVAIFLITLHHLTINNLNVCGYNKPYDCYDDGYLGIFINSFAIVGVNLFILISGWFGIKRIWSNILRLVIDVAIIGLINIGICHLIFGYSPNIEEIINTCSYSSNWFILHFIILILCSPFIEVAFRNKLEKWKEIIICLSIVVIYFGYYKQILNPSGYNALNFIFLYIIARVLHQNQDEKWFKILSQHGIFIYVSIVLMQSVLFIAWSICFHAPNSLHFWSYNSPIVLCSSIVLFSWFSQLKIKYNRGVNTIATGTLGVYLFQSTIPFSQYRGQLLSFFYPYLGYYLSMFTFACLLFIIFDTVSVIYVKIYKKVEVTIVNVIK